MSKPTAFSYADYVQVITERDLARLDCAVAERNHMNTLERLLEAQELIDELKSELAEYNCDTKIGCPLIEKLKAENISLRAERDALAKSICIVSEPIETIQPRGIVE